MRSLLWYIVCSSANPCSNPDENPDYIVCQEPVIVSQKPSISLLDRDKSNILKSCTLNASLAAIYPMLSVSLIAHVTTN